MKILVADDSKTNLALISESLKRLGHVVLEASDGFTAIEIFKNEHPDLVILDVVMQGMDGFECARKLRLINPEEWIPIIFLSSSVDDKSISKGIEAGGDDYLTKPYSELTLEAKIKAMQRIAEMRQQLLVTTEELRKLSSIDPLTEVYNRFQFDRSIKERLSAADRRRHHMALLFVDLDHFKSINDSFGHKIGDLLLKEVATRIKKCTRMDDFIARMGGDEFIIILSDLDDEVMAGEVAKKVVAEISRPYELEGNVLRISASVGIAFYPAEGTTHQSIVQNADIAMYAAKEKGRNNFQYFNMEINERYRQQLSLEHELKFALERNQLSLCYQPVYNLLTRKIVGMEALLRWTHPEFGSISPNIFIPIAEETGLILEIGNWVIRNVCEQGAVWVAQGFNNFRLSLNLSLLQFVETDFIEHLTKVLVETKLPTSMLELELTESTLITYTQQLKNTMKALQQKGIGIAIDDFGTRYSSLTSLRYLPITTLKIDKVFMKDVNVDQKNAIIVKSLIALGVNLNLNVIAEGVQTEDQMQFLVVNSCTQAQGFLFSKPIPADQMTKLLEQNIGSKGKIKS